MFSDSILKGKTILITGGSSGIGKEMGHRFAQLGARVAIIARRKDLIDEVCKEMESYGFDFFGVQCDVRNPDQISDAYGKITDEFGLPNVLVNNAAGNFISPTEKLSTHAVDAVISIVLNGTLYSTIDMGKRWIENGNGGTILNIVTTYSWTGSAFVVPSAAAKAGVLAVTRSLAVEWAKYGIRHVAIAPGPFPTEATRRNLSPLPGMDDVLKRRIPVGRFGNMDEITNLAAYLISDYASFINGEVVTIDGGEWLRGAGEFNDFSYLSLEEWEKIRKISTGKR
ncbi:MAG: SDR family oxidoreductase [Thermoplasmata archaeon]